MSAYTDGWGRPVARHGTCPICGAEDVGVGAGNQLLSHLRQIGGYLNRCYGTGRRARNIRDAAT